MFVFATGSMASENCFDRALISIYRTQERVLECDPTIDTRKFDVLTNKIEKWNIVALVSGAYSRRILKAIGEIYEFYYSTLPYGEQTKNNPCIKEEIKKFPDLKEDVLDAIVMCSL